MSAARTPEQIADKVIEENGLKDANREMKQNGLMALTYRDMLIEAAHAAQTAPATAATGSSERLEAARKALAMHDAGKIHCYSDDPAEVYDVPNMLADALRALIEPPATIETPEQIAARVLPDDGDTLWPDGAEHWEPGAVRALIAVAVQAGIQAAWESWEPENAPGLAETPAFKVENLRRDASALFKVARLIQEASHYRNEIYDKHPRIKENITEARRILEALSSEDGE